MKMSNKTLNKISSFFLNLKSQPMTVVLFLCASFSVIILFLMLFFVAREGALAFSRFGGDLFFGMQWDLESNLFGGLPLLYGSLMVTFGALLIAIPIGVCTAIFVSEVLPFHVRDPIKSVIELLASIPSVIYGFIGLLVIVPFIASTFGVVSGQTALAASLVLSIMTIPTIVSVSGEIISAVPKDYKEAALGLGATKWETIKSVVLPISKSGILASIMLGFGRAVGETIAVSMIAGNQAHVASSYLEAVYTIPSFIATHMGEAPVGSLEYSALFGLGLILLIITFIVNTLADIVVKRGVHQ
ncbi:MAG: phosphate ABC transporter permease subunit PstC [Candidatus Bathyarchaeum sp.]|nr:MAG: phosphate ABC transporter permease subunit PstC [Candidatus Bathyarchaeum sp.]